MNPIPFLDLKAQYRQIKAEVFAAFEEVCEKTAFTDGFSVKQFEANFAQYCQTRHAVAVNNGTSALHLAMLALGIKPGDEVIIPANTFVATAWGASYVGATPVFVDCDPLTWEIDPADVIKKITPRTKVIAGVHLYGQPCDVKTLKSVADAHKIFFLEDAAQAQGARVDGVRVGGFGEMACFSFYPGKNLGAYGEAGGITTNNPDYDAHLRRLRNHGSSQKYYHDEVGYNMRMGGLEGAVLDVKLKYLDAWNERRRTIAAAYQKGITNSKIKMQVCPDGHESVYHLFVITTEDRNKLDAYLKENQIFAGMHYPVPCHLQKAYAHLGYQRGDFPHSEYLADHCLSLPMFAELGDQDVQRVIDVINAY